jgi:cyclin-dependent kinase 7
LTESHIKTYFRMMLDGLAFCHANFVLHRDMKPENLLIGSDGQLRLADFGLAKSFPSSGNMTAQVATIWYRPPELLFGAKRYSAAIDVWGAGCIFAEMMLRNPLFQAESESAIEQLQKIFNVLGTPAPDAWPGVTSLPDYVVFTPTEPLDLRHLFVNQYQQPPAAFNVLMQLLELDPNARGSCEHALKHEYFTGGAHFTPAADLPHKLLMPAAPPRGPTQEAGEGDEGASPDHKRRRR